MSAEGGSICFDRAASFYDKTRSLEAGTAQRIQALLRDEIGERRCLEIGVGTGRIALPLSEAGVAMVGLDLSSGMLATLVARTGGRIPFPLIRADATKLPIRDSSFEASLASWVLHLIGDWRDVVAELVRATVPGGLVLVDLGGRDQGIESAIKWHFRDEAGVTNWPRGPKDPATLDARMKELGATPRPLPTVTEPIRGKLEDEIRALEEGIFSVTWDVDETTRKSAANATREWAEARFGSLSEIRNLDAVHEWRAYDLG